MSPYELGVMLHYYAHVDDHESIQNKPPIWRPTVTAFINEGLLREAPQGARAAYQITERGRAFIDALQRVPLPVQVWTMPRREPCRRCGSLDCENAKDKADGFRDPDYGF